MLNVFNIEKLSHISLKNKLGLKIYPWKKVKNISSPELSKPLCECKIAIITTAGFSILEKQQPFDKNIKGGDWSFREIPVDVHANQLIENHRSDTFDHSGIEKNPFSVLPIPHIQSLVAEKFAGHISHRHFSIMGSIIAPVRFIKRTIPNIVKLCIADSVDVVLLVPVWPICHQTVCLIQKQLGNQNIACVSISMIPEITQIVGCSSFYPVPYPLGFPLGLENDFEHQKNICQQALSLLED